LAAEVLGSFLLGLIYLRVMSAAASELVRSLGGFLVGLAMFAAVTIFAGAAANPAAVVTGIFMGHFPWLMIFASVLRFRRRGVRCGLFPAIGGRKQCASQSVG
jgi:hypothetical protein